MPDDTIRDRAVRFALRAITVALIAGLLMLVSRIARAQGVGPLDQRDIELFRVMWFVIAGLAAWILKLAWDEIRTLRRHAHWVRNCLTVIAIKLDVELPKEGER